MPGARVLSETGVVAYDDALFLALAEDAETVVTAYGKLMKALKNTPYAHFARPLSPIESLFP